MKWKSEEGAENKPVWTQTRPWCFTHKMWKWKFNVKFCTQKVQPKKTNVRKVHALVKQNLLFWFTFNTSEQLNRSQHEPSVSKVKSLSLRFKGRKNNFSEGEKEKKMCRYWGRERHSCVRVSVCVHVLVRSDKWLSVKSYGNTFWNCDSRLEVWKRQLIAVMKEMQ